MKLSNKLAVIAVFDFDGTITKVDTFNDIIIFKFGLIKFVCCMLFCAPLVFLYLIGLLKNDAPKKFMLSWFFRGMKQEEFNELCLTYSKRINQIIRFSAVDRIKWHKTQGHEVVIVSASITSWILPWASTLGIDNVIATEVEVKDGLLTGKFLSPCCYGEQKVLRLKSKYPKESYQEMYAYGDSKGDANLLLLADYPSFRIFVD